MTAASRVLFDEPGPRGRARIRIYTVLAVVLSFLVDGVLIVVQRLVTPTGLKLLVAGHH